MVPLPTAVIYRDQETRENHGRMGYTFFTWTWQLESHTPTLRYFTIYPMFTDVTLNFITDNMHNLYKNSLTSYETNRNFFSTLISVVALVEENLSLSISWLKVAFLVNPWIESTDLLPYIPNRIVPKIPRHLQNIRVVSCQAPHTRQARP